MITRLHLRYLVAFSLVLGMQAAFLCAADLSITAASVVPNKLAPYSTKLAGVAITAGQPLYVASDNTLHLASAGATTTEATCVGIAVDNAAVGQPCSYITSGNLTAGATLVAGTTYVVSAAAGKICPIADLTSGNYLTILGVAKDTTTLTVRITATGSTF